MGKRLKPERSRLMLDTPMSRLIPKMAVPTIIAQIITTIYNLADTYFVSSLGTAATAAVGVNASIERIITLLGSLIGMGASTYVARLLGAKRKKDADTVLSTSFLTAFGLGIVILTVGLIIKEPLVMFLGATEDCKAYSIQYIQYVLLAAPFLISSFIINMSLRSEGSATYSMIGIGFGGILNMALDPLFIFGLNLGVAGASIATAISKFVSFSILLTPYLRRRTTVTIAFRNFKYKIDDIIKVLTVGSTSFFRSVFNVIALIIINRIAGTFSTAALAAISVANRVMDFPFHIILGFTQGFQPVAGYNWGAKRFDRVRESLRFSLIVGVVGGLIMAAIIFCGAVP
ncbi:MAG: MATE family efflux transporter, partial [Oscillospiraceae bacterium]|nr:MATE family efflux transporter [Oscillospiraceae bacterium]